MGNLIISAVIPYYNYREYLLTSLRSIQNQEMTYIEIIIVGDYSDNETVNIKLYLILYCHRHK